jgi:hypothetical protein
VEVSLAFGLPSGEQKNQFFNRGRLHGFTFIKNRGKYIYYRKN